VSPTKKIILLVEDNPNDQLLARRAWKKHGINSEIVVASDGAEAVAYLFGTTRAPTAGTVPTVIFLDLKLPKLDGFEILKRVREDTRTRLVPVVVLTSSSEEKDIARCYALGANSFICKPVDFEKYSEAVGQLGIYWTKVNEPFGGR
jgi:two-component system response regulator